MSDERRGAAAPGSGEPRPDTPELFREHHPVGTEVWQIDAVAAPNLTKSRKTCRRQRRLKEKDMKHLAVASFLAALLIAQQAAAHPVARGPIQGTAKRIEAIINGEGKSGEVVGGSILYRPVVTGSARFKAMGRTVAVAGTENVMPDERCTYEGTEWACGMRARTAFRYFIRGRAVACALPADAGKDIVADCRIGSQDVGAWLVMNGWARAALGGPYAEAEKQAREAKRGIFGPPPETGN